MSVSQEIIDEAVKILKKSVKFANNSSGSLIEIQLTNDTVNELACRICRQVEQAERERIIRWLTDKYCGGGMGVSRNYSRTARYQVAKDLIINLTLEGIEDGE